MRDARGRGAVTLALALATAALSRGEGSQGAALVLERADWAERRTGERGVTLHLEGDVRWSRGRETMRSDRADYSEALRRLDLIGAVHLSDSLREVRADTVVYWEDEGRGEARGHVEVLSHRGDRRLEAPRALYWRAGERLRAPQEPILHLVRREGEAEYIVRGSWMESRAEEEIVVGGPVQVTGDSLMSACDSARYDAVGEWIHLRGGPWVQVRGYRVRGREIDAHVPGNEVREIRVRGRARGESHGATRAADGALEETWIEADSLSLLLSDERPESLIAMGGARSVYIRREDSGPPERNYVRGDRIALTWTAGEIERILVAGSGRGVYLPPPAEATPSAPGDTTPPDSTQTPPGL